MSPKSNKALTAMRRVNRTPKRKFAGNLGAEGRVTSRYISAGVATASGQDFGWTFVAPALHSLANDPGGAVISNYSNYRVLSSKFIFVPAVGTTTAGTFWVAYIDNPETIYDVLSGGFTITAATNIVQNMSTAKAAPIWEGLETSVNRPARRKLFNVDTTSPASAEVTERTVQGMWLWVTTSCPLSTTLGTVSEEYTAVGENLQPIAFTGV